LVKRARQELRQERQALERRIEWTVPGLIWSMDDKCAAGLIMRPEGRKMG
jgi:hypothetical protein